MGFIETCQFIVDHCPLATSEIGCSIKYKEALWESRQSRAAEPRELQVWWRMLTYRKNNEDKKHDWNDDVHDVEERLSIQVDDEYDTRIDDAVITVDGQITTCDGADQWPNVYSTHTDTVNTNSSTDVLTKTILILYW